MSSAASIEAVRSPICPATVLVAGHVPARIVAAIDAGAGKHGARVVSTGNGDRGSDAGARLAVVDLRDTTSLTSTGLGDFALPDVPVLGVLRTTGDLAFAEAFAAGCDDVITRDDAAGVAARVSAALDAPPPAPRRARGIALVASADPSVRVAYARVLRAGGFSVAFASDVDELAALVRVRPPSLVIEDTELSPGARAVSAARGVGVDVPWILATPPRGLASSYAIAGRTKRVAVHDAFGPPVEILFLANFLERADLAEQRASPRMLFGTRVVLHADGEPPIVAFSYNVSEGGLFARTLVPVAIGAKVTVEFQPPRTGQRVRLPASVAWRRPIQAQNATAPIGVGIHFEPTGSPDLALHVAGCRSLADPLGLAVR